MSTSSLSIPGCRHDILGHNLKAIGLLRALATCADTEHCDPEAEAWWNLEDGRFYLRSGRYPSQNAVIEFFRQYYRPTPIFSPWNKGGGLDEKQELVLSLDRKPAAEFLWKHRKTLRHHGFDAGNHRWRDGGLAFIVRNGNLGVQCPGELEIVPQLTRTPRVRIQWSVSYRNRFVTYLRDNLDAISASATVSAALRRQLAVDFTKDRVALPVKSAEGAQNLPRVPGIVSRLRVRTSGEKSVLALVETQMRSHPDILQALSVGRAYYPRFHESEEDYRELIESLRDKLPGSAVLAVDAVLTARTARANENPLFLRSGEAGNSEIFRSFWSYFLDFRKRPNEECLTSLFEGGTSWQKVKAPGAPFYSDAIKTYNNGLQWVVDMYPFNALDYLLAVEGALALRGAVSRTLSATSRRFAAFPFVFDSGEDLVDEKGDVTGVGTSVWLPLWDRATTYAELASYFSDAQARLPRKEARFPSEFARALRAQGVDAGFAGWQEFRFKMKASRVPWVCTGRYLGRDGAQGLTTVLSDALAPLDDSGFLDQFEVLRKGNRVDSRSPHRARMAIDEAIERTVGQPTPENALEILTRVYAACKRMALSKSFRETLPRWPVLFRPLPQAAWERLLDGLDTPEYRVARALAAIAGLTKQRLPGRSGEFSNVQPMLGSLLPLKKGRQGWYIPSAASDLSMQGVWTGSHLANDLARVLWRRYLDSLEDDRPALSSPHSASLTDILAYLKGELDDSQIARWTEALSLIDWRWNGSPAENSSETQTVGPAAVESNNPAIPPAYAAMRALIELECDWRPDAHDGRRRRRSQRPVALVCERVSGSLAVAVREALHWLAIWGIPNHYGIQSSSEKPRLAGRDVIRNPTASWRTAQDHRLVERMAAAVLIPLDWRDRAKLFRAVTLPQISSH